MKRLRVEKTVSDGIAEGNVYIYRGPDFVLSAHQTSPTDAEREAERFAQAREKVLTDLQQLVKKSVSREIFQAHTALAEDSMLREEVLSQIRGERCSAEAALDRTARKIAASFEAMDDEYMRERAADVKDVAHRLMAALKGIELSDFSGISEPVILVARELYPSDLANLDLDYVKGIIIQEGGATGHVSVMARDAGLPALTGAEGILNLVHEGAYICMDAKTGEIVIDPDDETKARFREREAEYRTRRAAYGAVSQLPARTEDGREVRICANVGNLEEVKAAAACHVDGIGLFRTEFLYMESDHFPTEEEQYEVYREAAEICPAELTIRTLDIGGDKRLPYAPFDEEDNPALGWRGIRVSLERREIFKTQLRAVLRASAHGHIRLMFPMIVSVEELREAKRLTEECKKELEMERKAFDREMELGIMVETPAAVILAEEFAKEADFFSIGTNDLTQYLLAADRGNKKVSALCDGFHPAVLRAVAHTIRSGHKYGITVGMCGELAGDERATELLLEMGLDEFSMPAGETAKIKYNIRKTKIKKQPGDI